MAFVFTESATQLQTTVKENMKNIDIRILALNNQHVFQGSCYSG